MGAVPEILSRFARRLMAKPEMPELPETLLVVPAAERGSTTLTEAQVEDAVRADFKALLGKVILVSEVECYDSDGMSAQIPCSPPAIARITDAQGMDSVVRWMDDDNCDPTYGIEVLEPHPALAGFRPSWVYGTSRAKDGTVAPGSFVVAPESFQRWYRDRPEVPEEAHVVAAENAPQAPTP